MKLLLASSGFTNESIIKACEDLVGKPRSEINFIILNEAIKAESGDHRWFFESASEIATNFGGNLELLDLQAHPLDYVQARIAAADAVFCFGGSTDYLAETFIKTGFAKILSEILAEKVWVGSSAGSCVLCHKESQEASEGIFEEKQLIDHYLDLVPIVFLPHLHGWFKFDTPEILRESSLTELPVYAMSDQSALVVTGDPESLVYQPVGTDYLIAERGALIS